MIEEFRADVTKTRKDGSKGALRIDYGNGREPQEPVRWLWKYIDGAKTAGELYGRALVVIAAEQYASRLVVPQSQRTPAIRWSSHKDLAAKALSQARRAASPGVAAPAGGGGQARPRGARPRHPSAPARPRSAPAAGGGRQRRRRGAHEAPDVEGEVDATRSTSSVEEGDEAEQ